MKWNWGKGIVVGMIAFMCFIMYMVITMSTNKKYSHDLVTEEYYAKEIAYQQEIDAETNTSKLKDKITGQKTNEGWLLQFPSELNNSAIKGHVYLYRPSNKKLDTDFPLTISDSKMLIPKDKLIGGRWNITIEFKHNGKDYLYKNALVY